MTTRSKLWKMASVTRDGVTTTLTFTELLKEEREVESLANGGDNIFLVRGGGQRSSCTVSPWPWRGVAWTLLIRTAIACSDARALIPNSEKGMWFQWHRGINLVVGIVLTVVGIAMAVYIIQGRTKRLGGTFFEAAAAPPNRASPSC
jgi:hypothetical protein